jgi:hypothetical protein
MANELTDLKLQRLTVKFQRALELTFSGAFALRFITLNEGA